LVLERETPWYAAHRDFAEADFCSLEFYGSINDLPRFHGAIANADAVIIGSYVPQGAEVIDAVRDVRPRMLCFYDIDTPVTMAKLDAGDEEYLRRRQVSLFDIYFSFSGGPVLQRLETHYGAQRAAALYCSVDPSKYYETNEQPQWDLGYLGTYSPDRQAALQRLLIEPARRLPDCKFVIAGSQYPDEIDWPANVERIGHLPPSDHASFYSRQRFTLNITRSSMVTSGWSPSVRLFEAAACATPIISDRWDGLTELLPEGEAVLIADSSRDVLHALTALPESARRAIACDARARVLAGHTGEARARELVAHLLDHHKARLGARSCQKYLSKEAAHDPP
jgi:spore maturation protein CgeB